MQTAEPIRRAFLSLSAALVALTVAACDDGGGSAAQSTSFRFDSARLCPLVAARDPAAAAFPPTPPVRVFGTDLGFTYERDGIITILFGDSWQRIDVCPLQLNDDSIATLAMPPANWPGFDATESIPAADCPELTFVVNQAGNAFAPIELRRWDGVVVPLGPLNTPVAAFHDGVREWTVFIVGGGQRCSAAEAAEGAPCPTTFSTQAADLTCGPVAGDPLCLDTTSTKEAPGNQAYYLHFAERVGPASFVSRAMFLTNKYLNLTARAVRAFDESDPTHRDYEPGTGALLMWGRPGFDDQNDDGEAPPYFMHHSLPLEVVGDRLAFAPRYFTGLVDGTPTFGTSQAEATPLYTGELEPVNQAAVSWIAPIERWLTIYGGSTVDFVNVDGSAGQSQPVPGALYARLAEDPWGPWTEPVAVFTNEQAAGDIVCGKQAPEGCLPPPTPPIRPACLEIADPKGGGVMYGANIIDSYTRSATAESGSGPAADVFWDVSTWHPYSVVLVRTHIEAE